MDDRDVISRIGALVEEERRLREHSGPHGLDSEAQERLQSLEVALDQCWDLLRQRRAKEEAGENPDAAQARPTSQVEGYLQ